MLAKTHSLRFGLKPEAIEKICNVFSAYPQIQQVILYGSRAKGTQREGSDIDLAIQGDLTLPQLLKIENTLDDLLLPYHIDLALMHHIYNPKLLEHIGRVGEVFYAK